MVRADEVISPQDKLELVCVVYDEGDEKNGTSIAWVKWEGQERLAVRWNGWKDIPSKAKGTPLSRAHAVWFILPNALALPTLETVKQKAALGNVSVRQACLSQAMQFVTQKHQSDSESMHDF